MVSALTSTSDGAQLQLVGFTSFVPTTNALSSLGTAALGWSDLYVDNGSTDGGQIFFNAGGQSITCSADGLTLTYAGFTTITLFSGISFVYSGGTLSLQKDGNELASWG